MKINSFKKAKLYVKDIASISFIMIFYFLFLSTVIKYSPKNIHIYTCKVIPEKIGYMLVTNECNYKSGTRVKGFFLNTFFNYVNTITYSTFLNNTDIFKNKVKKTKVFFFSGNIGFDRIYFHKKKIDQQNLLITDDKVLVKEIHSKNQLFIIFALIIAMMFAIYILKKFEYIDIFLSIILLNYFYSLIFFGTAAIIFKHIISLLILIVICNFFYDFLRKKT